MVLLCWEYNVFLQQLEKCFKYWDVVYLRHWTICSKSSYYSPVKHLIHLIYLNLYEHRAWSLNISTAAQLNSGLETLLTSFTEIHLLWEERTNRKRSQREEEQEPLFGLRVWDVSISVELQNGFTLFTGYTETNRARPGRWSALVGRRLHWRIPPLSPWTHLRTFLTSFIHKFKLRTF